MATVRDVLTAGVVAERAERWLSVLRGWLLTGTLLSALGFALPWFRVSTSYRWWYGGWHLLTTNAPDLAWVSLIFLSYAILFGAGFWLHRLDAILIGLLVAIAIGVVLTTLIVVALAASDAIPGQGGVYRLDLHLGLFLMLPAHGLMVAAALAGFVLQMVRDLCAGAGIVVPGVKGVGAEMADPAPGS